MRREAHRPEPGRHDDTRHLTETAVRTAPYSSAQTGLGICLVLAGLLNGGSQYLGELLSPDHDDFSAQIAWGADHATIHQSEQFALLVSMLFLPLGLLGLAQVARWHARRLTLVATLLTVWGMWGFTNVVALGYAAGSVGPGEIGVRDSVALNDGFIDHAGVMAGRAVSPPARVVLRPDPAEHRVLALRGVPEGSARPARGLPGLGLHAAVGRAARAAPAADGGAGLAGRPPRPDAAPCLVGRNRLTAPTTVPILSR